MTEQKKSAYVLVPRIPTKEMLEAAWADALGEDAKGVWQAMIEEYEKNLSHGAAGTERSATAGPLAS